MSEKRLSPQELEAKKLDDFLSRLMAFLADDPYWMYVLTMEGGRRKRRQVADEVKKLVLHIPHVEPKPLNREMRRTLAKQGLKIQTPDQHF